VAGDHALEMQLLQAGMPGMPAAAGAAASSVGNPGGCSKGQSSSNGLLFHGVVDFVPVAGIVRSLSWRGGGETDVHPQQQQQQQQQQREADPGHAGSSSVARVLNRWNAAVVAATGLILGRRLESQTSSEHKTAAPVSQHGVVARGSRAATCAAAAAAAGESGKCLQVVGPSTSAGSNPEGSQETRPRLVESCGAHQDWSVPGLVLQRQLGEVSGG
jgi:hypothetical protein